MLAVLPTWQNIVANILEVAIVVVVTATLKAPRRKIWKMGQKMNS